MKHFFYRALLALMLFAALCVSPCSSHEFTTPARYREMVSLKGGTIKGSSANAIGSKERNRGVFIEGRTVTLSAFKMAKYQTTYQLWKEVYDWATSDARGKSKYNLNAGREGYPFAGSGKDGTGTDNANWTADQKKARPVTNITWRDAIVWCNAYSELIGKEPVYYTDSNYTTVLRVSTNVWNGQPDTAADLSVMKPGANGYRLPTEAEWEYAARGGDQSDAVNWGYTYAGSSIYDSVAWVYENSDKLGSSNADYGVHPVGTKAANKAGLYDMNGNVWEWCQDYAGSIGTGTEADPVQSVGTYRVIRGGSWDNGSLTATVASRSYNAPNIMHSYIGFRFVCRE
jgi:formylglycine-generating enzyme required for sulfatase activity